MGRYGNESIISREITGRKWSVSSGRVSSVPSVEIRAAVLGMLLLEDSDSEDTDQSGDAAPGMAAEGLVWEGAEEEDAT